MNDLTKIVLAFIWLFSRIIGFIFFVFIVVVIALLILLTPMIWPELFPQKKVQAEKKQSLIVPFLSQTQQADDDEREIATRGEQITATHSDPQNLSDRTIQTDRFGRKFFLQPHIVANGQDFIDVCRHYNVNEREVLYLNGLRNGRDVHPGDVVQIPIYIND